MTWKLKGIRRRGQRWQTYVNIAGTFHSKTWPLETPLETMRQWQQDLRLRYHDSPSSAEVGPFSQAVAKYLTRVSAMPTFRQRGDHLALWVQELGSARRPESISSVEIDMVLQRWLEQGLAPATVRKRRTALQSFFALRNGKHGFNPVRATANPRPPKPEARGLAYDVIERMLDAMPTYRDAAPGASRELALGKIRARVIAYTGLPPHLIKAIQPHDLNLVAGTVHIPPRRKGRGIEARTLPLTGPALEAFKDFHAAQAYGGFATSALNVSIKRAFKQVGVNPQTVRLYDLRHSFLTELYRVTRDHATVQRLGLHAEGSPITAIYTRAAHEEIDQAAVAAFNASLAKKRQQSLKLAKRGPTFARKLPAAKLPA